MQFNPEELIQKNIYKLMTGLIIPRPIAWVSTTNDAGTNNLAPFSYFNAVGDDPPHLMFSISRSGHLNKDTLNNILANQEFVVNMVTEDLAEQMNTTSRHLPAGESEFDVAGLTAVPSTLVKPPLVKESLVSMECKMVHNYTLEDHKNGGSTIIIGKILLFHIAESVLEDDFRVNMDTYKPISRLAGSNYARMGELFAIKRLS